MTGSTTLKRRVLLLLYMRRSWSELNSLPNNTFVVATIKAFVNPNRRLRLTQQQQQTRMMIPRRRRETHYYCYCAGRWHRRGGDCHMDDCACLFADVAVLSSLLSSLRLPHPHHHHHHHMFLLVVVASASDGCCCDSRKHAHFSLVFCAPLFCSPCPPLLLSLSQQARSKMRRRAIKNVVVRGFEVLHEAR